MSPRRAAAPEPIQPLGRPRTGPLCAGERVSLSDTKGAKHSIVLTSGAVFHTTKGGVAHDDIIGQPDGTIATSVGGLAFLVFRPLLNEYLVSMPREAAIVYPRDAAQIVMGGDIFPGARVLEAGAGSGALSLALLRAIGPQGHLTSYERRADFAAVARANVVEFFGKAPATWEVVVGDLVEAIRDEPVDRAVLDMLAPWECVDAVADRLVGGGVLTCYVTTVTQLGRIVDQIRAHGEFTEPSATETISRDWHAEGLAIRPAHGAGGHTGFLVQARRLAPGVQAPPRRRRPAEGAYGPDYTGPLPRTMLLG